MVHNSLHRRLEIEALKQERKYFCQTSQQEWMRRRRKIVCKWDSRNMLPTPPLNNRG
jgi:hypothetical protein